MYILHCFPAHYFFHLFASLTSPVPFLNNLFLVHALSLPLYSLLLSVPTSPSSTLFLLFKTYLPSPHNRTKTKQKFLRDFSSPFSFLNILLTAESVTSHYSSSLCSFLNLATTYFFTLCSSLLLSFFWIAISTFSCSSFLLLCHLLLDLPCLSLSNIQPVLFYHFFLCSFPQTSLFFSLPQCKVHSFYSLRDIFMLAFSNPTTKIWKNLHFQFENLGTAV